MQFRSKCLATPAPGMNIVEIAPLLVLMLGLSTTTNYCVLQNQAKEHHIRRIYFKSLKPDELSIMLCVTLHYSHNISVISSIRRSLSLSLLIHHLDYWWNYLLFDIIIQLTDFFLNIRSQKIIEGYLVAKQVSEF